MLGLVINIKLDWKHLELACVEWTHAVQDGESLQAIVNIQKSFRFPQKD